MDVLISSATGIPLQHLNAQSLKNISVAERMRWASSRKATRREDLAYSLLGLFGINMPLLYGEGARAFYRLQSEILKESDDESIFLWWYPDAERPGILAPSLEAFSFYKQIAYRQFFPRTHYELTNKGLRLNLPLPEPTLSDTIARRSHAFNLGEAEVLVPLNCTMDGNDNPKFIRSIAALLLRVHRDNQDIDNSLANTRFLRAYVLKILCLAFPADSLAKWNGTFGIGTKKIMEPLSLPPSPAFPNKKRCRDVFGEEFMCDIVVGMPDAQEVEYGIYVSNSG